MDSPNTYDEADVARWTQELRHWEWWVRDRAAAELEHVDFAAFEQTQQTGLLLAALNAHNLRDRARDSLARVLPRLGEEGLARLGPAERADLRRALSLGAAYRDSDFLIAVANALPRLGDTAGLRDLERLVERTKMPRAVPLRASPGYSVRTVRPTFRGLTAREVRRQHRVHTAAHVACERLRLLAERPPPGAALLRSADAPDGATLLRPAGSPAADPDCLPRSVEDEPTTQDSD